MIDKKQILAGLSQIYGKYEGLDKNRKTPENYSEYLSCLLPGFFAHTEQELLDASALYGGAKQANKDRLLAGIATKSQLLSLLNTAAEKSKPTGDLVACLWLITNNSLGEHDSGIASLKSKIGI